MKGRLTSSALVGTLLVVGSQALEPGPTPDAPPPSTSTHRERVAEAFSFETSRPALPTPADLTDVVRQYCVSCHNDALVSGNVSLQGFEVAAASEKAETAERVIRKLRAGMMPPPGMPRPGGDTLMALVETLEDVIDRAAATAPNPGTRRFQRLNRTEYEKVIYDLLGLEIDAGSWLPADTYLGNFDNLAAAQGLSTTLLEAYLRAATEISRLAVGNPGAVPGTSKYSNPFEVSQHAWDQIEGAPYGTRGGMVVLHDFPADGEYVFTAETVLGRGTGFQDLDISIDGEGVALLALEHNGGATVPIMSEPIFVRAGQRRVSAAFVKKIEGPYEDRLRPHRHSLVGGEDQQGWANYGITVLPHLTDLMITGPSRPRGVSETASRARIFTCRPSSPGQERPCAESIISRLATEAYRRRVDEEALSGPMSFYGTAAAEGGFEVGVRTALQAILASPSFIFRLEEEPADVQPGEIYQLSDLDLASRLSFFLWGTVPDEQLLGLATEGRLSDEQVLEHEVRRMLADPRSEALATRFASQWLRLQDVDKNQPEPYFYPNYNRQLAQAIRRETELLFDHLVREDRSLLELFTAEYTFLNDRLAQHYGIESRGGSGFQRVEYPSAERRGLLGHASVLVLTSLANRTSPVLRGKWVMEVLLGTPPPPPPPNVPDLEATSGNRSGRVLTTRERMEIHRQNPTCNACHQFMDPIGLALDNFDVVGQWRIRENGMPLDTRGIFYDGTPISTQTELREALLKRPVLLVRTFTENLLAYAMGRRVEYYDKPAVRAIAQVAEANDYRLSSFFLGVVKSEPFRKKRAEATADEAGTEQR